MKKYRTPVIKVQRRRFAFLPSWVVQVLLLISVAALSGFGTYYLGREGFFGQTPEMSALMEENQSLKSQIKISNEENAALKREIVMAERASAIEAQASHQMVDDLSDREQDMRDLQKELNFYKSLVTSKPKSVEIRSIELVAAEPEGVFDFKLMLVGNPNGKARNKGTVDIKVQGTQSGKEKKLDWKKLKAEKDKKPGFDFQYFQHVEGKLKIPEGFQPENIHVMALLSSKKGQSKQQSYSWNTVIKGENYVGKR